MKRSISGIGDGDVGRPHRVAGRRVDHCAVLLDAVGANAAAAANAGHYNASGTVHGPRGVSHVRVSGYDPGAAQLAQMRAAQQNDALISRTVETGQRNMARLEAEILKDNTVLPGEWYGGQLTFDAPEGPSPKTFRVAVQFGQDRHEIDVSHLAAQ